MAIYHLNSGFVSRSTGRSSVQSAAYITGATLHESRRDLEVSYKNRISDIAFTDTLAPEHAPAQFHTLGVWDILENFEDSCADKLYPRNLEAREKFLNSARPAQTIMVALPRELTVGVSKELVEEFAKERFVSRGLIVTYAIHDDEGNPHAHLQISRRAVNENGELSFAKDRDIVTRKSLLETRKLWADLGNKYLEREGFEVRITEKSYADLGINLEPSLHRGWVSDKLSGMGIDSRVMNENAAIFARNREVLIDNPGEILPELTSKAATFTQSTLLKTIQKRIGDDAKLVAAVFEGALQQAIVVGEDMHGQMRYTSPQYQAIEAQAISQAKDLASRSYEQPMVTKEASEAHLANSFSYLSKEQKDAVLGLTQESGLAVLIGRAGAGKTTTLKAVSEIYQNAGHRVIGTSLSSMAADNLGNEAGIKSATLHSWLYQWNRYQTASERFLSFDSVMAEGLFKQLGWYKDLKRFEAAKLTKGTVLIVDEAGMVGTRQWGELLVHVQQAGAKLIAVGDDNQFKAIEAGDFFRELKTQVEHCDQTHGRKIGQGRDQGVPEAASKQLFSLSEIRRQQHVWMRDASHQLAELNIAEGLSVYEQRGHVHQTTLAGLSEIVATAYVEKLQAWKMAQEQQSDGLNGVDSQQTGLVLAFTNAQTNELNQMIREKLRQVGLLNGQDVAWIKDKAYAIGDQVVFLKNSKQQVVLDQYGVVQKDNSIKNGTRGTIAGVDDRGNISIQLADNCYTVLTATTDSGNVGQPAATRSYNYEHLNHGYAVTTHKSQGQTVDFTIVAASKNIDAKGLYVAMTRHRDDVQLFYAKEDFQSFKALTNTLSRFDHKDLVKDYTIRSQNEEAWHRVQEYKLCALDAAAVLSQGARLPEGKSGAIDWQSYNQIKHDQVNLGKEIMANFGAHQLYVNQAGLTEEMLQISTGQKARLLAIAEQKAKITVEIYGEVAHAARGLWQSIRKTHPGDKCYQHSSYPAFKGYQQERNSLAHEIAQNYPLHREFVNQFSRNFGINAKTVEAQSRQFIEHSQMQNNRHNFEKTTGEAHTVRDSLRFDNSTYGKYLTKSKENSQFQNIKNNIHYQYKSIDASVIKQELNANIKDLAFQFLGKPEIQKATEWRYGNKGCISINVAGTKLGLYSNFETGESGNVLKFIQDQLNCDHKQAFKWGAEWLGKDPTQGLSKIIKDPPQAKQEWLPIFPVPSTNVDLQSELNLACMLKGRVETARYAYKDANSNILGYAVRLEDKQGNKVTTTLTYCQNDKGQSQWRLAGNDRPLYGLDQLKEKFNSPVLIVEGEKTCEAARVMFPEHAVVTWSGGCGSVNKSDWTVLQNRDVTIWPDNDRAGINAAATIADILKTQGNQEVKIVDLPPTLPQKWDLADKIPDGINVKEMLACAIVPIEKILSHKVEPTHDHSQVKQEQPDPVTKEKSLVTAVHQDTQLTNSDTSAETKNPPLSKQEKEHQEKLDSIVKYINTAVKENRHARIEPQKIEGVLNLLEKDQFAALQAWQRTSHDYSFSPLTKEQEHLKQEEAKTLFDHALNSLPFGFRERLVKDLPHHAQGVIEKCQEQLERHHNHLIRQEIAEFKYLCQKHQEHYSERNIISSDKECQAIEKRLGEIVARHGNNPDLLNAIAKMDNKHMQQLAQDITQKQQPDKMQTQKIQMEFER